MGYSTIPFSQRKVVWIFAGFFLISLFFITYIVDIEQIIIPDSLHFQQPLWLPASVVDLIHMYGSSFDPLLVPLLLTARLWKEHPFSRKVEP